MYQLMQCNFHILSFSCHLILVSEFSAKIIVEKYVYLGWHNLISCSEVSCYHFLIIIYKTQQRNLWLKYKTHHFSTTNEEVHAYTLFHNMNDWKKVRWLMTLTLWMSSLCCASSTLSKPSRSSELLHCFIVRDLAVGSCIILLIIKITGCHLEIRHLGRHLVIRKLITKTEHHG